jgi:hypothetical protein
MAKVTIKSTSILDPMFRETPTRATSKEPLQPERLTQEQKELIQDVMAAYPEKGREGVIAFLREEGWL